jgi:hypothetical protein
VLVENSHNGIYNGLDQYFNRIHIRSEEDLSGNWIELSGIEPTREGNRVDFVATNTL